MDYHWHAVARAATVNYFVTDLKCCQVHAYAQSMQAYTNEEYREFLKLYGFEKVRIFPHMGDADEDQEAGLFVIAARKGRRIAN